MSAVTLDKIIGVNLRCWREGRGLSQDQVATMLRSHGLPYFRSTVSAIESGQRSLPLNEALLLAVATGAPLSSLMAAGMEGAAVLSPKVSLSPAELSAALDGVPAAVDVSPDDSLSGVARGDAEMKAAKRLGLPSASVASLALSLWGHSLTAERERRLSDAEAARGPRALQALRGHVTRALYSEMQAALTEPAPKDAA